MTIAWSRLGYGGDYHSSMYPVIGITARPQVVDSAENEILGFVVTHTYTDSILRSGGIPVLLPPVATTLIDALLDRLDGILLTGGDDIAPERYGAQRHESVRMVDQERDEFELALVRAAYERKLPTMGICRGNQVVNVAFGGSLVQDLVSYSGANGHEAIGTAAYEAHSDVIIEKGSWIAAIIGDGRHRINSIHHQAADRIGDGLRVVGSAPDGTVEALEHEDRSWPLLSVQWHPEYLGVRDDSNSHDLFTAFIESAAKFAANS